MMHTHHKVREVPILRNRLRPDRSGLVASSFPGLLRDPSRAQNPTRIGQKSVHFHECEFFSSSASTTYTFDLSKQTDFPANPNPAPTPDPGQVCRFASLPLCVFALKLRRKLNKTERFRTELAGMCCTILLAPGPKCHHFVTIFGTANSLPPNFQPLTKFEASNGDIFVACNPTAHKSGSPKSNKTERFRISPKLNHAVPTTYDDTACGRSISTRAFFARVFVVRFMLSPKMRKNETHPKTRNTEPLRPRHLPRQSYVSSRFAVFAGGA
jgi:hypothetical protein